MPASPGAPHVIGGVGADHKFVALDGLRGLAAIAVVYLHVATLLGWPAPPGAYLCVDLFFLLSGFVVPYAYEARLGAGMSRWRFLEIRLVRLYPLYILGCAISLVPYFVIAAVTHERWKLYEPLSWLPWAVLMLPRPTWEPARSFLLNPPAWSLFLELVVNIAYAAVLPRLSQRVLVAVIAVSGVALGVGAARYGTGNFGTGGLEMLWGLARVAFPFATGVLLFRRWREGRMGRRRWPFALPATLFVALIFVPQRPEWAGVEAPALIVIAAVIVALGIGCRPAGRVARWCEAGGLLSYPLYALHMPILESVAQLDAHWGIDMAHAVALGAPLAVLVAIASIRLYDVPVRAAFTGWLRRRRSPASRAA